jgi:hypothetical protein
MRSHFFITGLPRTRTAWLANFFTGPHSFCLHDGLLGCKTVRDLVPQWQAAMWDYPVREHPHIAMGDSDSALVLVAEQVLEAFPGSRWLHVTRPWEDAMESYLSAFKRGPAYLGETPQSAEQCKETFRRLAERNQALPDLVPEEDYFSVPFYALERRETMLEAWQWLMNGVAFPAARWRLLDSLNVQMRGGVRVADLSALRELMESKKPEELTWH